MAGLQTGSLDCCSPAAALFTEVGFFPVLAISKTVIPTLRVRLARVSGSSAAGAVGFCFQFRNPASDLSRRVIIISIQSSVNTEGLLKPPPDKQHILDSIAAIARGAGHPPSRSEFLQLSGISEHYVSIFFPSWNDAVRAAGLRPWTINERLDDSELLGDWACVVRRNRKIPPRRLYRLQGQYDPRTIERRFGPWSRLPEVFRNFAKDKPEWADVVTLLPALSLEGSLEGPVPPPKPAPQRPAPASNSIPSPASEPEVAQALLPVRFSPSNNDRAPNRQSPSPPAPGKVRYPPLHDRPTYGRPIDFRGLRHEPVNEQGVVLLFGLVAKELGYIVESVQSGFPDCEAKRQIAPGRWQRVHLEFEFESRNFRDHGHAFNGCDVIVCWRHNWPDCPPQIEILELSSLIKSLPTSND